MSKVSNIVGTRETETRASQLRTGPSSTAEAGTSQGKATAKAKAKLAALADAPQTKEAIKNAINGSGKIAKLDGPGKGPEFKGDGAGAPPVHPPVPVDPGAPPVKAPTTSGVALVRSAEIRASLSEARTALQSGDTAAAEAAAKRANGQSARLLEYLSEQEAALRQAGVSEDEIRRQIGPMVSLVEDLLEEGRELFYASADSFTF